MASDTLTKCQQVLVFCVEKHRLGLCLQDVDKVVPLLHVVPVPGAPEYVVGVMPWQQQAMVVVDMAERLGIARERSYGLDASMILLSEQSGGNAYVVDEILQVFEPPLNWSLNVLLENGEAPFLGALEFEGEKVLVLDTEKLQQFDFSVMNSDLDVSAYLTAD